jgi:hypothetical protein
MRRRGCTPAFPPVRAGLGLLAAGLLILALAACGETLLPLAPSTATPLAAMLASPTAHTGLPIVPRGGTPTPRPTAPGTPSPTVPQPTPGPGRPWPDTSDGIHVFNDQLALYGNPAWVNFAATHYAGTQKMTRADADALRAVNPNFLILHYRLGIGLGYRAPDASCQPTGEYLQIIDGDWVQEWPGDGVVQPSWFFPYAGHDRVYNCDWGWYLMEVDDPSWRAWWSGEVLRQLAANDDDGLFADSLSVPNYLGADCWDPALPAVDPTFEAGWAGRLEGWMDYLRGQFGGNYVLVPNAGSWVTGRDPTDYGHADGVMIEGFGYDAWADFGEADWHLQLDRVLGLVGQGRIILAQAYYNDTPGQRLFSLASYLLIKGTRTYVVLDVAMEPEWWPEYGIPIGSYVGGIPATLDELYDGSVYRREYSNGLVLVNPGAAVTVGLEATYYLAQPTGGGIIPDDGQIPSGWTVNYAPVTQVTLEPGTAAVLLESAP